MSRRAVCAGRTTRHRHDMTSMNTNADTFAAQFVVLPVVHLSSTRQGVDEVAFEAGAHGVFLIDHAVHALTGTVRSGP